MYSIEEIKTSNKNHFGILLKEMYLILLNEKKEKYDIYKSNQEIIKFIDYTLYFGQNALSIEEWLFVIKEIYIYVENLRFHKDSELIKDAINSIVKIIINNFNKIKHNKRILIEMKELLFLFGKTNFLSDTIIEFCLNSIKNDCIIDFIEPLIYSEFCQKDAFDHSNTHDEIITVLLTIALNKDEQIREEIRKIVTLYFSNIIDPLSKTQNLTFCELIVTLIINSNNYQELQKELFNFPKINESNLHPKNDVDLINQKTNYSFIIIKHLLKRTFSMNNKQLLSDIIQLSLSKSVLYDFYPVEEKGFQLRLYGIYYYYKYPVEKNVVNCTTVTLISKLIMETLNKGKINFLFDGNDSFNRNNNELCHCIDLDSIFSNYIYHIGIWVGYIFKEMNNHYSNYLPLFDCNKKAINLVYAIIEKFLNYLFFFSKDNISELLNIYIYILNQTSLVDNIDYSSNSFLNA